LPHKEKGICRGSLTRNKLINKEGQ